MEGGANNEELQEEGIVEDGYFAAEEGEDGSGSDAGNLNGSDVEYLIDDIDMSEEGDDAYVPLVNINDPSTLRGLSEGMVEFLRRLEHNNRLKWETEADMRSDFGKHPTLCMKVVCAIHRRKIRLEGGVQQGQGSNKYDKDRCTLLGDFLTGGDPKGFLVKSVEELEQFDPNGLEVCKNLAMLYSKKLFKLYKTKKALLFI